MSASDCSHETLRWDAESVDGFRPDPCGRPGAVWRNGRLFCRLHDPERPSGGPGVRSADVQAFNDAVDRLQVRRGGARFVMHTMLDPDPLAVWLTPRQTAWQQAAWEQYDKGVEMSTAERLRIEAERLLERAAKIEALPTEPKRGRYFALDVQFRTGPTVYKYVLVRVPRKGAPALYYATGRNTTGLPWSSVVTWSDVESATLTRLRKVEG